MRVKLKNVEPVAQDASQLDPGTWFLDVDNDVSLVVEDNGTKRIMWFGNEPYIRANTPDEISVQ